MESMEKNDPTFSINDIVEVIEHNTNKVEMALIVDNPEWDEYSGGWAWWYKVMTESRLKMQDIKCIGSGGTMRKPHGNELFQYYIEVEKGILIHKQFIKSFEYEQKQMRQL